MIHKNHKVLHIAQILLGLMFFVFGLNGFLQFIPMPPPKPEMMDFMGALMKTGYFFPLLKGAETICGLLLILNRLAPLALVILSPIVVNIVCVHTFLDRDGLPMALVIVVLMLISAFRHRAVFCPLLCVHNGCHGEDGTKLCGCPGCHCSPCKCMEKKA